jgi:hypothetical protein
MLRFGYAYVVVVWSENGRTVTMGAKSLRQARALTIFLDVSRDNVAVEIVGPTGTTIEVWEYARGQ